MAAEQTVTHARPTPGVNPVARLWKRDLAHYPPTAARYWYLGIVVITTVVLYYQLYIVGAVATQVLGGYHMTFLYYVTILVITNAIGAFASLAAGIADRIGRANLVVFGTIITSLIALVAIPNAHTKLTFGVWSAAIGLVEGVILVATPALVRDFSPQVGRAAAMGFWTMGPVIGSLVVSEVSSHTLSHLHAWQDQFIIAGIVGLVVALVALLGLRELSAGIRDQIMVSLEEHTAVELRARGMDIETATRNPFGQMLKPDIFGSAIAISLFLLGYYTAVAFFPIYFQTVLGFTQSQSNSLLDWYWAFNAGALIFFGALSDRLRVRKPFMLVGAVGSIVISVAFLTKATHDNPSYYSVQILLVFIGIWGGAAFAPWMAGFTETVERHNPALTATGLAIWGWTLRLVVAVAFLILPHVITSVTPLVDQGAAVQAADNKLIVQYPLLAAELTAHPDVFQSLAPYANPADIPPAILQHAIVTVGAPALQEASQPQAKVLLDYLGAHAAPVQAAQKVAPHQWQRWLWVSTGGQIVFIPLIFAMSGYWRPRSAKRAQDEQMARNASISLSSAGGSAPVPSNVQAV